MIVTGKHLHRRTFLKGMGAAIALPMLDAMTPAFAMTARAGKTPLRLAFTYVPNGITMAEWTPTAVGSAFEFTRVLKPLERFRGDTLVISGLAHRNGTALGDGPGDHARAAASYLTGVHPRKTAGADIQNGISVDQVLAQQLASETRFPSIELGCDDSRTVGNCDSGYSCAYTNNLAWRSATQPLPPILNPRALFERLFGNGVALSPEARARQSKFRRSILDFVTDDTKRLQSNLGPTDKRKLEEYLSSIREIERQIDKAEKDNAQIDPHMDKPYGIPADFAEHFKLMTDMITVAFQADLSRVLTFLVTREGSSRAYREIGISDGHHPVTHHRRDPVLLEKVASINSYHMKQFAAWIEKLKSIKEGDATLLDNSMIVYGAGLADGDRHAHDDLPTLIAGRAGGAFKPGRRIVYRKETPMSNLFLTMMDRMEVHAEHFGDATGRVHGLDLS